MGHRVDMTCKTDGQADGQTETNIPTNNFTVQKV